MMTKGDAFRKALEEELRALREDERSRFGEDVLAWLAVAPAWPESIAGRCGFPGDLAMIGPELERRGLAQRAQIAGADGREETHWWMPPNARRDTIAGAREGGGGSLVERATLVAQRMLELQADLPAALARWAVLAAEGWGADRRLRREVAALVAAGNTGDALGWVESARFAAGVFGGPIEAGTVLAERRIELAYRREHDEKLLAAYLERAEQTRWVNDLLDAADERWALHLLGAGGVGKTMLLRHVMARVAPARGLVAVRIDFDHLSPDYPVRRPGQLVAALAGELSMHATAQRQAFLFDKLDEAVTGLDEALSGELPPSDPLANVRRPELEGLLELFAEILRLLPSPVLLVLDTCEELAKLTAFAAPGEGGPPAVAATFELLERLHAKVPSARVLFAGRRFLAPSGRGWEALGQGPEAKAGLPERPYLALEELRGFDEGEADALLSRVFRLDLDPERRGAVLARSREMASARVRRSDRPDRPDVPRFHPFDLALYGAWIREDPRVDPAKLGEGGDPYVELRILGRIESAALRAAMPALVVLRRFDRAMGAAALGVAGEKTAELLRLVAAQEWIDVQPDDEGGGVFYEIHRALWPRLLRFYAASARRGELDAARRRVGPALDALAQATPPSKLRAECVDAALRALDPKEGGALWAAIEERAAREGAYERLGAIAERLLAEEGAVDGGAPLRAHVLATFAGVQARGDKAIDLVAQWQEVEWAAEAVPDRATARWLSQRAYVGRIGPRGDTLSFTARTLIRRLFYFVGFEADRPRSAQDDDVAAAFTFREAALHGSLAAALDWVLDVERRDGDVLSSVGEPERALAAWADALASRGAPIDLLATSRVLAARAAAVARRWEDADRLFAQAIAESERADLLPRTPVLEGRGSPSLAVRARLERASFVPLESVGYVHDDAAPDPTGDRGRLLAHEVLVALARRFFFGAPDEISPVSLGEMTLRAPRSEAARRVPMRFAAVARLWTSSGHPARALDLLERVIDLGLKTGHAAHAMAIAEREKLRILRRYRLSPGDLPERLASSDDVAAKREAIAYLFLSGALARPWHASEPPLHTSWLDRRDDRERVEETARAALRSGGLARPEWKEWLTSLPERFLAELALEEGEELARLDAARAAELLAFSCDAFQRSGDALGALFAAALRLAAEQRAGRDGAFLERIWWQDVRPNLPDHVRTEGPRDNLWAPWRARLAAWAALFEPGAVRPPQSGRTGDAFADEFPAPAAPQAPARAPAPAAGPPPPFWSPPRPASPPAPLPRPAPAAPPAIDEAALIFSMEGDLEPAVLRAESGEQPAWVERSRSARESWPPPIVASGPYMGLPIDVAAVQTPTKRGSALRVGLALVALGGLGAVAALVPGATAVLAWAVGIAAGTGGVYALGRRLLRRVQGDRDGDDSLHALAMDDPPLAGKPKEPAPRTSPAQIQVHSSEPGTVELTLIHGERRLAWKHPLPDETAPYEGMVAALPYGPDIALDGLGRGPAIELFVLSAALASLPWEALVSPHDPGAPGALVCRTRQPVPDIETDEGKTITFLPPRAPRFAVGSSVLLASRSWSSFATHALRAAAPRIAWPPSSEVEVPSGPAIVIGAPLRTGKTGVVLRIDADEAAGAQTAGVPRTRQGALLRPDSHPLFNAPLVVLMAEPLDSFARGAAERRLAADLRSLAHAVAGSAEVVLAIPPLPPAVAERALIHVANWLVDVDVYDSTRALLVATWIRAQILAYPRESGEHDGRFEAAIDVVLYVRNRLDAR